MRKVRKEVGRNSSREEIKEALRKACTAVPDRSFRRRCKERVEKDGDKWIDMIVKEESTDTICKYFGYCWKVYEWFDIIGKLLQYFKIIVNQNEFECSLNKAK